MNKEIKVFIADNNTNVVSGFVTYLQAQKNIEVVGTATNGKEAITKITKNHVDVIIIDAFMPVIDGLGVLEKIKKKLHKIPICIMLSISANHSIAPLATQLGVQYFTLKPFKWELLLKKIRELVRYSSKNHFRNKELDLEIIERLNYFNIPIHLNGYQYLYDGIIMSVKNLKLSQSITTKLYPRLAKKYNVTPKHIERAMRNAIECGYDSNKDIENIFTYILPYDRTRPTNSEFIATIADKITLKIKVA